MTLGDLNDRAPADALHLLLQCCASQEWAMQVAGRRPFYDLTTLIAVADRVWLSLGEADWLEAFGAHPRIGQHTTADLSRREQAGVLSAADVALQALAEGNAAYEQKFGFIFIVFAADKTAEEILGLLHQRLGNDRATELQNAGVEQMKITRARLLRLLGAGH